MKTIADLQRRQMALGYPLPGIRLALEQYQQWKRQRNQG